MFRGSRFAPRVMSAAGREAKSYGPGDRHSRSPEGGREMDWNGLLQFALLGRSHLEEYAILLVRVSLGLFFAVSGGNKLFVAGGTKPVYETLVKAKIPFPRQTAYFVSSVEFVCGSLLVVGFLSSPASLAY